MGGSPGITELMARLLREVEGGSAVRARFVGDGVSASGRGLCGREAPGWLRRGACSAGCCASGSAGRTGPRDAGQAGERAGPGERPGALGLAGLGRAWGLLGQAGKREGSGPELSLVLGLGWFGCWVWAEVFISLFYLLFQTPLKLNTI